MSNALTNFLSNFGNGLLGNGGASMKDYQHADRLYVQNNYARAPKAGFLYFVNFNINDVPLDANWKKRGRPDVGLLVKEIDLPKFAITTETLNQYNRKTVVQTKLNYNNISMKFHDDNSDITNDLWKNYYQYYYTDSIYGAQAAADSIGQGGKAIIPEFVDTKYDNKSYPYGYNNFPDTPFFRSIDIFVLHKGHGVRDFTQITLVNPTIIDWSHDSLSYDESGKMLSNKMTVAYESVYYNKGKIKKDNPSGFTPPHYDTEPSPLKIGGSGSIFGAGGILSGASDVFGEDGTLENAKSPLDYLGVALQTKNLIQGVSNLKTSNLVNEGYSIAAGSLVGSIGTALSQPLSNSGGQGTNGITLYRNNSVQNAVQAIPSTITSKSKGKQ